MRESKIEKIVCEYAKSKSWLVYKFVSPSNRGVPDRILFKNGKTILIEFKSTGKKLRKLQEKVIKDIKKEKIKVYIIDSINDGKSFIDNFK